MDDLACAPGGDQLLVERQVERHGVRALPLEAVAGERRKREAEVSAVELVVLAGDRDGDRAPVAQRRRDARRIERRDGRGELRHALAEARAERAEVGLDGVGAELVGGGNEAQRGAR